MENLKEILKLHEKWLNNEEDGVRANLSGAVLIGADLSNADLRYADLSDAILIGADLSYSILIGANLSNSNLSDVNLIGANLSGTCLIFTNLRSANLSGAILIDANLRYAKFYETIGNEKEIKTYQFEKYTVNIVKKICVIQIGCENHTYEEWFNFTDEEISEMDEGALEWWNKHKEIIKQLYNLY